MTIVHILEDFSFQSGGIRTVLRDLHMRLLNASINSIIVAPKFEQSDSITKISGGGRAWCYSSELLEKLNEIYSEEKKIIIHIHGVWMYPQYASAKFAYKNKIPYVVSCHGMYEPWLWTKGTMKKKLYFNLLTKSIFSKANFIHAITEDESLEIKKLMPKAKTVEIPNLIDFQDQRCRPQEYKEKYVLSLGRLDEKKGIDILLKAFSNLDHNNINLKIAGEFNEYKKVLDNIVSILNLQDKVQFLGMVKGDAKAELFRNAFVFAAPSRSEAIGMVNLEAALYKTPVITTYQTGIDKDWQNNGGFLINPAEQELTVALKKAINLTLEERNDRGKKLHDFVLKKYSWENRFFDWIKLYESML